MTADTELDLAALRVKVTEQLATKYADRSPAFRKALLDELIAEVGRRRGERLRQIDSPDTDVLTLLGVAPTAKQRELIEARELDVFYGGAAGGAKSVGLVMDAVVKAHRHPGLRAMLARGTYGELEESIYPAFDMLHWAQPLGAVWNGQRKTLSFRNGSVIRCRYLEAPRASRRVQGGSYQYIGVDERTLLPPGVVENLRAERLRTRVGGPPIIGLRGTGNPGGPSHAELRSLYVDPTGYGQHLTKDGRRYIPSKVTDNPYLNPEYVQSLASIPDPRRRAAMLEGRWDLFEGMMFDQWNPELHVVPAFPIPDTWRRYAGIDGGFAAPWSTIWLAIDPDGRGWVYDALRGRKVIEREQAARILLNEQADPLGRVEHRWADSAMWAVTGEAPSAADLYLAAGCKIEPAAKGPGSRVARARTLHAWLGNIDYATGERKNMMPACAHHRAAGLEVCPRLHVLDKLATASLQKTIRDLPRDEKDPEDVDTNADDHDYDALTYMLHMLGGMQTVQFASATDDRELEDLFADT